MNRMASTTLAAIALAALAPVTSQAATAGADELARGGYLVNGFGCGDCHTPLKEGAKGPEPDLARGLSGHPQGMALPPAPKAQGPWLWGGAATNTAFHGPWGVSYAANLTPDARTGIGSWTAEQFIAAMKTGRHVGAGRPIAPPMPWRALGTLTEADLRAMFAYLKSRPAVPNAVPEPKAPN